jgi:hypothetical protein
LLQRRITFLFSLSIKLKPKITIADHFLEIEDPRIDRTKRHKLIDIMTIAVCAVICGADGWVGIEQWLNLLSGLTRAKFWLLNGLLISAMLY